jgi:hypothetical protein
MGQSQKNARRGGSKWAGALASPGPTDWSLSPTGPTEVTYTRRNPPPPGVTGIIIQLRASADIAWLVIGYSALVSTPIGGLSSGTSYDGRVQWAVVTGAVSENSEVKTTTTP